MKGCCSCLSRCEPRQILADVPGFCFVPRDLVAVMHIQISSKSTDIFLHSVCGRSETASRPSKQSHQRDAGVHSKSEDWFKPWKGRKIAEYENKQKTRIIEVNLLCPFWVKDSRRHSEEAFYLALEATSWGSLVDLVTHPLCKGSLLAIWNTARNAHPPHPPRKTPTQKDALGSTSIGDHGHSCYWDLAPGLLDYEFGVRVWWPWSVTTKFKILSCNKFFKDLSHRMRMSRLGNRMLPRFAAKCVDLPTVPRLLALHVRWEWYSSRSRVLLQVNVNHHVVIA